MICYFADRRMVILGLASTEIPQSLRISNDLESIEVENGVTTLSFTLHYKKTQIKEVQNLSSIGNYVLMEDEEGRSKYYTIITKEHDRKERTIDLYCEDAGLDLLNEAVTAWGPPEKAQPIDFYINRAIYDSGFEIGINELENLSRTLSWDGEATATERLLSIATQFDHAEIGFSFAVERMSVVHKYIDIYKKRGVDTQIQLRLGRDINNIIDNETIENLATALRVTGGTPEGSETPINLNGYKYDDGDLYTEGIYLKSRSAVAQWSRYLSEGGTGQGHITVNYNYDTLNQSELCNRAITQLKKLSQVEINYEIDIADLPKSIQVGDRINIVDEEGELYLQARILKLEKSRANKSNKATLGEFLIKDGGISERLKDLADKVSTIKAGDTYYPWVRYADDDKGNGFSAAPLNKKFMAIKYGLNQPTPSDNSEDYHGLWSKIVGPQGEQGIEGPAGSDGKPTFTWSRYADAFDGTGISANPLGKKYLGLAFNKAVNTPSNIPSDYTWSAMYDEDALKKIQEKVDSIVYSITSPSEPKNPVVGQAWWQQDSSDVDKIIGYFVWDGKKWQPQTVQQSVLNIIELNAVKIYGAEITGTTINGSKFTNTFSYNLSSGAKVTGVFDIENGAISFEAVDTLGYKYTYQMDTRRGVVCKTEDINGNYQSGNLGNGVLALFKKQGSEIVGGSLTAEALAAKEWKNISYESGYTTAEDNPCQYRIIALVDGTKELQLRGQARPTSGNFPTNGSPSIAILPVEARPTRNELLMVADSTKKGARIGVLASGVIQVAAVNGSSYVALGGIRIAI